MKFSRENCLWGIANYFAVNSSYSHAFAHKTGEGSYQMLLARVIIGNTIKLEPDTSLRFPPLLPGEKIKRYDSIQGKTKGHDVYMVYANKKAYPEYLITYQA